MSFLPPPSLSRRVVLSLLAAFVLVWLALLVKELATFKTETGHLTDLHRLAAALAAPLPAQDEARARAIVAANCQCRFKIDTLSHHIADLKLIHPHCLK